MAIRPLVPALPTLQPPSAPCSRYSKPMDGRFLSLTIVPFCLEQKEARGPRLSNWLKPSAIFSTTWVHLRWMWWRTAWAASSCAPGWRANCRREGFRRPSGSHSQGCFYRDAACRIALDCRLSSQCYRFANHGNVRRQQVSLGSWNLEPTNGRSARESTLFRSPETWVELRFAAYRRRCRGADLGFAGGVVRGPARPRSAILPREQSPIFPVRRSRHSGGRESSSSHLSNCHVLPSRHHELANRRRRCSAGSRAFEHGGLLLDARDNLGNRLQILALRS